MAPCPPRNDAIMDSVLALHARPPSNDSMVGGRRTVLRDDPVLTARPQRRPRRLSRDRPPLLVHHLAVAQRLLERQDDLADHADHAAHADVGARRLISRDWVARSWAPCAVKPEYGCLWWLNDGGAPWPTAPRTSRSARGNGGRHLRWVDPARDVVLCSRWTEHPADVLRDLSAVVPVRPVGD